MHTAHPGNENGTSRYSDILGERVQGISAALDDELNQLQVIEGGSLHAFFGTDIRIDEVAHGWLTHLEIDVVISTHSTARRAGYFTKVLQLDYNFQSPAH